MKILGFVLFLTFPSVLFAQATLNCSAKSLHSISDITKRVETYEGDNLQDPKKNGFSLFLLHQEENSTPKIRGMLNVLGEVLGQWQSLEIFDIQSQKIGETVKAKTQIKTIYTGHFNDGTAVKIETVGSKAVLNAGEITNAVLTRPQEGTGTRRSTVGFVSWMFLNDLLGDKNCDPSPNDHRFLDY